MTIHTEIRSGIAIGGVTEPNHSQNGVLEMTMGIIEEAFPSERVGRLGKALCFLEELSSCSVFPFLFQTFIAGKVVTIVRPALVRFQTYFGVFWADWYYLAIICPTGATAEG
jgi:hypothetical protein